MPKVKINSISQSERMRLIGKFFDVIYGLKTKKETVDLLIGLLTPSESLMLARRIEVARYLLEEKTYDEIRKKLKVSYQTISIIEGWLNAREGAYRKVLKNKIKNMNKKISSQEYNSRNLLDRYPQHRFLKDLLGF